MQEDNCCTICGHVADEDELILFDGDMYCEDCLDERTVVCCRCGERVRTAYSFGDEHISLCQSCYDNHYTRCSDCDCLISYENEYHLEDDCDSGSYCYECYTRRDNSAIHNYSYKPSPVFYGDSGRYYGVELEIDCGGKSSTNAARLLDIANTSGKLVYIKSDGSLDDGLELVTHPMTLAFHRDKMPWADIMDAAIRMGYYSHKAKTCGLHIHVGRGGLGSNIAEQEECIGRVLFFVERFWQELLRFSRRTEIQIQRWAARYGFKERPKDILEHAKTGSFSRYACVNITGYDTVEFRIFRGTLKHNTLIAALQMVDEICNAAVSLSDDEFARLSWPEFVAGLDEVQYPELVTYLKERRLYVNEPINSEEDE